MLCRKILLSGSVAKTSLQPNAVWCQKSLKHFSARGIHHAERLVLLLHQKYYTAWTSDPFTVSLGDDGIHMGPVIFFLTILDDLCRKILPEHTCTSLANFRSHASLHKFTPGSCQAQPESWLSGRSFRLCSRGP